MLFCSTRKQYARKDTKLCSHGASTGTSCLDRDGGRSRCSVLTGIPRLVFRRSPCLGRAMVLSRYIRYGTGLCRRRMAVKSAYLVCHTCAPCSSLYAQNRGDQPSKWRAFIHVCTPSVSPIFSAIRRAKHRSAPAGSCRRRRRTCRARCSARTRYSRRACGRARRHQSARWCCPTSRATSRSAFRNSRGWRRRRPGARCAR